jgi:acyl-CoA synthetase (AMP-forming)/AMP-acid ligase II
MSKFNYAKYWKSFKGDTVGGILDKWAERKPNGEALIFKERKITWEQMGNLTDSLATAYLDLGMRKGDRIGILGPNHPEMLICWFAATKVGIIPVPLSTRYRKMELEYMIPDSGCSAVVTIDDFENFNFLETFMELKRKNPPLKTIIVHKTKGKMSGDLLYLSDLLKIRPDHERIDKNRPLATDPMVILYTSGTTGIPKGVVHTHDSMFCDAKAYISEVHWLTDEDVLLQSMPWSHMVGHQNFNNTCLLLGQKNVLMEYYAPEKFIDLIEKEKPTWLDGSPTMFLLPIYRIPNLEERDLSSLKFAIVCGFYCPPEQIKLIKKMYKVELIQVVGSTEAGCLLANRRDDPEEKIFATVGRPISNKEIKICNPNQGEVRRGEIGELWYRGPSVFKYYWNKPDLTRKEKDDDGFWHSGDLGKVLDEEGNICFMGRVKDVIIRGGFNIYPAEVEAFMMSFESVDNAVLIGYPDNMLGEKTCCLIQLKRGAAITEEKIRRACREILADFKVPDQIKIKDSLPLLPSGKVDRITVRKQLLNEMGLN